LVAVADVIISKAKQIGERFSVPYFDDMHKMMLSVRVDVVVVLTESGNHAKNVIDLALYGKDIIVEKPMALTVNDADKMIKACNNAGIKLFVVKQNRFNVPVVKLREALLQGRFEKIFLATVRVRWCRPQSYYDQDDWRGTWLMDGGVLTNQASHHVDLLEWMMGDVESVYATSIRASAKIEVEDTALVIINFKNGAIGAIEATTATRPVDLEGSISILGSGGTVVIDGFAVNKISTWNFSSSEVGDIEVMERYSTNPPNVYGFGHQAYYEHVIDCIIKNKKPIVDGEAGRKSLELINAIYRSIETKSLVMMDDVPHVSRLGSN
jgi:predicted dehydrogenase